MSHSRPFSAGDYKAVDKVKLQDKQAFNLFLTASNPMEIEHKILRNTWYRLPKSWYKVAENVFVNQDSLGRTLKLELNNNQQSVSLMSVNGPQGVIVRFSENLIASRKQGCLEIRNLSNLSLKETFKLEMKNSSPFTFAVCVALCHGTAIAGTAIFRTDKTLKHFVWFFNCKTKKFTVKECPNVIDIVKISENRLFAYCSEAESCHFFEIDLEKQRFHDTPTKSLPSHINISGIVVSSCGKYVAIQKHTIDIYEFQSSFQLKHIKKLNGSLQDWVGISLLYLHGKELRAFNPVSLDEHKLFEMNADDGIMVVNEYQFLHLKFDAMGRTPYSVVKYDLGPMSWLKKEIQHATNFQPPLVNIITGYYTFFSPDPLPNVCRALPINQQISMQRGLCFLEETQRFLSLKDLAPSDAKSVLNENQKETLIECAILDSVRQEFGRLTNVSEKNVMQCLMNVAKKPEFSEKLLKLEIKGWFEGLKKGLINSLVEPILNLKPGLFD